MQTILTDLAIQFLKDLGYGLARWSAALILHWLRRRWPPGLRRVQQGERLRQMKREVAGIDKRPPGEGRPEVHKRAYYDRAIRPGSLPGAGEIA